jgi:hypothetical protein
MNVTTLESHIDFPYADRSAHEEGGDAGPEPEGARALPNAPDRLPSAHRSPLVRQEQFARRTIYLVSFVKSKVAISVLPLLSLFRRVSGSNPD